MYTRARARVEQDVQKKHPAPVCEHTGQDVEEECARQDEAKSNEGC